MSSQSPYDFLGQDGVSLVLFVRIHANRLDSDTIVECCKAIRSADRAAVRLVVRFDLLA